MRFTREVQPREGGDFCLLHILENGLAYREDSFLYLGNGGRVPDSLFIGRWDGKDCFAVARPPENDFQIRDYRSVIRMLDEDEFALVATAKQLVHWGRRSRFCPACGGGTRPVPGESAVSCDVCGEVYYPSISPVVMVAVERDGKILLAHNAMFKDNLHSVIAGFVESGESLEQAARREVMEEVGIGIKKLRYFSSQAWPFPSSLIAAFCAEYESGEIQCDGREILSADWFGPDSLPNIPKGSISRRLIEYSAEMLRTV